MCVCLDLNINIMSNLARLFQAKYISYTKIYREFHTNNPSRYNQVEN